MINKSLLTNALIGIALFSFMPDAKAGLFDKLKKDLSKVQEQVENLQQGGSIPLSNAPSSNSNNISVQPNQNQSGASEETVQAACHQHWRTGKVNPDTIFNKLPSANIDLLKSDFSLASNEINVFLNNPPRNKDNTISSLAMYENAYETGVMSSVFSQYLKTTESKAAYLSIVKQLADKDAGFSSDKKAIKRDAQQMYGLILLYHGAKGKNGFDYFKAATKGDSANSIIATYQFGHRAYKNQDLTKAANWMLKSYQAVDKRRLEKAGNQTAIPLGKEFTNLVMNEFHSLVSEPGYPRRELYADLLAQTQQMHASMQDSMQNARGNTPEIQAIIKSYNKKQSEVISEIYRSIGDEQKAGIEEQRLKKYLNDMALDDQKNSDFAYQSIATYANIQKGLSNIKSLDGSQKKEFSIAMTHLGELVLETEHLKKVMFSQWALGNISLTEFGTTAPIFNGGQVACSLLENLQTVGTKIGAPKKDIVFDKNAQNTVIAISGLPK